LLHSAVGKCLWGSQSDHQCGNGGQCGAGRFHGVLLVGYARQLSDTGNAKSQQLQNFNSLTTDFKALHCPSTCRSSPVPSILAETE
jgi:hypothetical protein